MTTLPIMLQPTIYTTDKFPSHLAAKVALPVAELAQGFNDVARARADIMDDPTMTPEARLVALDRLYEAKVGKLIPKALASFEEALRAPDEVHDKISKRFNPPNDAAIAVSQEIRAALRAMSKEDRVRAVDDAVSAGELPVISAIQYGPEFLTGLSRDRVTAARNHYVAQHLPELHSEMEAATRFVRSVEYSRAALKSLRSEMFAPADERALKDAKTRADKSSRHFH